MVKKKKKVIDPFTVRKEKTGSNPLNRESFLSIRLKSETHSKLFIKARKEGMKFSEYIRGILEAVADEECK